MIDQRLKDFYYLSVGKLSLLSLWKYRLLAPGRFQNPLVHLCCGTNYIPEMINVDGNPFRKKDLWLDIALGLPFRDNAVRGIYISHSLEHFNVRTVRRLLAEFRRVLKPEGGLRIVVPSVEYAIESRSSKDPARFSDFPEKYRSPGGKFHNFLLCGNQHLTLFDFSFLEELLTDAGFRDIRKMGSRKSRFLEKNPLLFEPEDLGDKSSLYIECLK